MFPGASALVCGGQSTAIARGCGRILLGKLDHCMKGGNNGISRRYEIG